MKTWLFIICVFFCTVATFSQSGIAINGHVFSLSNGDPIPDQKVFVVFESTAQPYVSSLEYQLTTGLGGSFNLTAPNIPNSIIPLEVLVYTYDCDFQRKGFMITFNQNNVSANGIDIAICMGPIHLPAQPLVSPAPDVSCPAFFKYQVNDSLKRNHLIEDYQWLINGSPAGSEQFAEGLFKNETNVIQLKQTYTDSLTGFIFDSIQIQKTILIPDSIFHIIGGNVMADGIPTTNGKAVLLAKSQNEYFVADTAEYEQYGYYYFTSAPRCNYSVRIIEADQSMVNSYIPTYLGSELHWDSAPFINLGCDYFSGNINLVSRQIGSGLGEITGTVSASDTEGFDVILYTENMTPFAYNTCQNGYFHFDFLPYGNYYLITEKFGIAPITGFVALSMSSPTANIELNAITNIDHYSNAAFSVFPNPADRFLQLQPATDEPVQIYSVDGRLVLEINASNGLIDVSSLENGLYYLHFMQDSEQISCSFVVAR